ncbi:Inactive receptor-like serine/threonine-protein kinase, partial [Ananas comosus]
VEIFGFKEKVELDRNGASLYWGERGALGSCSLFGVWCSEGRVVIRDGNIRNANTRKLLQIGSNDLMPPAPTPTPTPDPTFSPISSPSVEPFPPAEPPWIPQSPLASTPTISFPSSPSSLINPSPTPAPTPSPITRPPSPQIATTPSAPVPTLSSTVKVGSHRKHVNLAAKYGSIAAGVSFFLAMFGLSIFCCRTNKVETVRPWATGLSGQLQRVFVTGVPALKRSELETACEDFSNVVGSLSGGMLYKGTLSNGVEIAVVSSVITSAPGWSKQCESQFRKKISSLSKVNHKNFMSLLGYCEEEEPFTRMMVFEYAPNGTLFEHLHVKEADHLDWSTRLRISMGIAYCLEYMHQLKPPVILSNLDSSTIFLTDDFAAKVSDLDLWTDSKGTDKASENSSTFSFLSDQESVVYKYGILILEIISGRIPFSSEKGILESWASSYLNGEKPIHEMIDPGLESFSEKTLDALLEVILSCIDPNPEKRPTMAEVVTLMREITGMPPDGATPKVSPLWWAELEIISSEAN